MPEESKIWDFVELNLENHDFAWISYKSYSKLLAFSTVVERMIFSRSLMDLIIWTWFALVDTCQKVRQSDWATTSNLSLWRNTRDRCRREIIKSIALQWNGFIKEMIVRR
jgi:hypothetical protein